MRCNDRSVIAQRLLELLKVNKVAAHLLCRELIEKAQHPLKQQPIVTAAELLRHDDAGMRPLGCLPLLVQWSEIADVEREDGPIFGGGKEKLFLIGSDVFAGFLGGQDIVAAATPIDGQSAHDVPIEVQGDKECLKAG